jgi:hypothetical protein
MRRIVWPCLFLGTFVGCFLTQGETSGEHHHGGGAFDGSTSTVPGDLPCDVANALVVCQGCHGPSPTGGAPMSLVSRADLMAQSAQYAGQTQAERCVSRMQGNPSQMPPPPQAASPQADIDVISAWITAGYPVGSCGTQTSVCTSGLQGTMGESSQMRPGEACRACHASTGGEAPMDKFMGTVFPTLHEPDDCVGASSQDYSGVQVVVIDAVGKEYAMSPNGAGNFMASPSSFQMPFTAKVTYQGREIAMTTPQTDGDCNGCHTELGANNAPGRIMLP